MLPGPLVSVDWLSENLDRVRPVDVRWAMGEGPKRPAFESGHLPGAVFADLDVDLSDPPGPRGRHPLPSPRSFAAARNRLGLDGSVPVVGYDDQSGATAARLWWMLDAIGVPAAVLDGGIDAWPGRLETGPATPRPAQGPGIEPVPWPVDRFIEAVDVPEAIESGVTLLDARSAERFAGRVNPVDDRPGHIPGSVSRPWTDNVDDRGLLHRPDRLRAELADLGVSAEGAIVASCGSGVTGCHDLLAARVAGLGSGRLYTGSWSEWSQGAERPIAVDPS